MAKHYLDERSSLITSGVVHPRNAQRSSFSNLADGKTLGKRVVLLRTLTTDEFFAPQNTLEVRGDDNDAMPLGITLMSPRVVPTAGLTLPADTQSITGEQDNIGIQQSLPAFVWPQPLAFIDWGIGGIAHDLICDIGNGLMINLIASYVRVRVGFAQLDGTPEAAYVVGATIGPSHSAPTRAQFTEPVGTLAAGATSASRFVPHFAKEVTLMANGNDGPNYTIIFFQDAAAAQEVGRFTWSNAAPGHVPMGVKVPLPGAAYYFRVVNNGGIQRLFRAIWDLAV